MIEFNDMKNYFSPEVRDNALKQQYILKEFLELEVLQHIFSTEYAVDLSFIGGTNLRLIKGIQRFSEDLDFDCKNFSDEKFSKMIDDVVSYCKKIGVLTESEIICKDNLSAYRAKITFIDLLQKLGLTGHKDKKFYMKIEAQDQNVDYKRELKMINRNGYCFGVMAPSDNVLCSMKLAAMLQRGKGRDFYDCMFLLPMAEPDFGFLDKKLFISSYKELLSNLDYELQRIDLKNKKNDFLNLVFNPTDTEKILYIKEFMNDYILKRQFERNKAEIIVQKNSRQHYKKP